MDVRSRCILVQSPPTSSFGNPQSKVIEAVYIETQHGAESSSVRVLDKKTGKEYFVTEAQWEAARFTSPPCIKASNPPNILGRISLDSVEAKVLGIGEKSGGLHTPLYDLLTKEELRGLTGIAARSEGELVGPREAVLAHERARNRPRILLLCKALSSKLNPLIFDEIYLIVTNRMGEFEPFQGPPPKTVLEFLKLLNFETERGPYTTKRLLGNSDWREMDLLWQYCELGLCPLPVKVFETGEECDAFLDSLSPEDVDDFEEVRSNSGLSSAFRNLRIEMRAKGVNPDNKEERRNYIRDNPNSDAVKDFQKMKRCYLIVKQNSPAFRERPEPQPEDYSTHRGYESAFYHWMFFPDGLQSLAKSITEELIYVARNPALCEEAVGIPIAQREREEAEAFQLAMQEARASEGGGAGVGSGDAGGSGGAGGSGPGRGSGGGSNSEGGSGSGGGRKRRREGEE